MAAPAGYRHRRFALRFYLSITAGVVLVAAVLDLGFSALQGPPEPDRWVEASLLYVDTLLDGEDPSGWPELARTSAAHLGVPVVILPSSAVVAQAELNAGAYRTLEDEGGRTVFMAAARRADAVIQIGPVSPGDDGETLARFLPPLFYLSIFALVAIWLRPLLRDLDLLSESAAEFARDYTQPLDQLDRATSLTDLATAFKNMAARLRELIEHQQALTNALSHEVRTPLARIKFAMAVMNGKDSLAARNELQSISEDVEEIDGLISAMLDYARLDRLDRELDWEVMTVAPWVHGTVSKFRAAESAFEVDVTPDDLEFHCDPHLMTLVLSNLLVNAERHASSRVRVTCTRDAKQRLAVEDDGEGIAAADRGTVFQPFTRLDTSRNRATGGYGLGLGVVARVARLHGGEVRLDRSELGGARFTVEW